MEKHQTSNEIAEDTSNALKQKTNQDFNGKKPDSNDPDLKEKTETPETEVPGIGDDQPTESGVITMEDEERNDTDEYKTEEPIEDEPLNPKPQSGIEGDSDAEQVVNRDETPIF